MPPSLKPVQELCCQTHDTEPLKSHRTSNQTPSNWSELQTRSNINTLTLSHKALQLKRTNCQGKLRSCDGKTGRTNKRTDKWHFIHNRLHTQALNCIKECNEHQGKSAAIGETGNTEEHGTLSDFDYTLIKLFGPCDIVYHSLTIANS